MQNGQIVRISNRWYVRYREKRNINGVIQNKRVSYRLDPVTMRGKHPPADIKAEVHIATVNRGTIPFQPTASPLSGSFS